VREEIPPQLYFPFLEASGIPGMVVYVRTRTEPAQLANTVREVVRELDPMVPVEDMRTMTEQVDLSVANDRLLANLSAAFGLLATLLAMIGLYGVMAYSVTRRTREIGVRMALGAVPRTITRLVMREVGVLMLVGVMLALPLVWGLTRFIESLLYGVTPLDPLTIGLAIAFLAAVAGVAGFLPAYRASRINPLVALRYE